MDDQQHTAEMGQAGEQTPQVAPADFAPERAERGAARRAEDLHICPACESVLVQPTDWAPAARRCWRVDLRCPDCEWTGSGTYSQAVVDRFDEALDEGTEAVLEDLNTLSRANMEEHVEQFLAALHADLILPEDF